ncbi:MAG: transposase family protein [Duodenibacillus massiliensis]
MKKGTVTEDHLEFFHETDGTQSAVVQVHATRGYRCRARSAIGRAPAPLLKRSLGALVINGIRCRALAMTTPLFVFFPTACRRRAVGLPGSRFTKDFDLTVAWLARSLPRSIVCKFMRIDWKIVRRCVKGAKLFRT